MRGPDRLNRVLLVVLSLLLIAAGAYALMRGAGAFGEAQATDRLPTETVSDFIEESSGWFWPAAAVVSLLLAYLGYRWVKSQIPASQPVRQLEVTKQQSNGHTRVRANGAAGALAADVERHHGVQSAKARFLSDDEDPEIELRVEVADDARLAEVRNHIEQEALERLRHLIQAERIDARLLIRFGGSTGRTVK